jgi:hypothetical protein
MEIVKVEVCPMRDMQDELLCSSASLINSRLDRAELRDGVLNARKHHIRRMRGSFQNNNIGEAETPTISADC